MDQGSAQIMKRFLLITAAVVIVIILLFFVGERLDISNAVVAGISSLLFLLMMVLILKMVGGSMSHAERERSRAEAALKDSENRLREQREELMRRNLEITLLYEITSVISREMDMAKLLHLVLEKIVDLLTFDVEAKGGLFVVEYGTLRLVAQIGLTPQFAEAHEGAELRNCLCAAAVKTGEIIVPASGEEKLMHCIDPQVDEPRGQVAVPLKTAGRAVGVLFLSSPLHMEIGSRRLRLLELIGSLLGTAIDNARLFEKSKELSLHDALTGLANRNLMHEVLENNLARARRTGKVLSIAMLDLDHFKAFNDTYGHTAGDKLLAEVAGTIQNETRAMDLAVRYGGEEFLLVLADTGLDGGLEVAERIHRKIGAMSFYGAAGQPASITISIGVASYDDSIRDTDDLIRRADAALYLAKSRGRNRVEAWRSGLDSARVA